MSNSFTKLGIATVMGALSAYLGVVAIPMVLLLILMMIDYGTGIGAAWMTGTLCSRKCILGILKKIGYLAVITVGIVCDLLIEYALDAIGQSVSVSYAVGLIIIIWLILNECISILENLSLLGVPIPNVLNGIVSRLKVVTEKQLNKTGQSLIKADDSVDETNGEQQDFNDDPESEQNEKK